MKRSIHPVLRYQTTMKKLIPFMLLLVSFAVIKMIIAPLNMFLGQTLIERPIKRGDLQIMTFDTSTEFNSILERQASSIPGINLTIVGSGTTWIGFGHRTHGYISILREMNPEMLVVTGDALDVVINYPCISEEGVDVSNAIQDFFDAFEAITEHYPNAIVAAAENHCCVGAMFYAAPGDYFDVDGNRKGRACITGTNGCQALGGGLGDINHPMVSLWVKFMKNLATSRGVTSNDIYVNAGLMVGRAKDMLRVLEMADFEDYEDDQAVFADFIYRFPNELILDYNLQLFGVPRVVKQACMFEDETSDKRLVHLDSGSTPLFIHSAGKFFSCHDSLVSRLGLVNCSSEA